MTDPDHGASHRPAFPQPAAANDPLARLRASLAGRYEIERELGRGGMATVYLARDLKHGREVAIKVLHPELASVVTAERFLLEIRTAARLVHPHILTLFDSGEAGGLLYYTMPHLAGESLADRLAREGPRPVEEAVRIAREVAEALAYAHERGVVHRDIKPANILLADHDHACIADFGLAHALSTATSPRLTATGHTLGSPLYMSPEQISGSGEVDGRADVYGLGCTLYEMLTGLVPFPGQTVETVLAQHLTQRPPPVGELRADAPAELARLTAEALAKDPRARPTASGLARALHSVEARTLAAGAPGRPGWLATPRQRWLWLTPGFAALLLLGVSLVEWSPAGEFDGAVRVAVLPIGGSADPNPLGARQAAALQPLLEGSIETVPELRAMDGASLVGAGRGWRSVPFGDLADDAREAGAEYLLAADVISGSPAMVSFHLFHLESGERVLRAVSGADEPIDRAVGRIGLEVARAIAARESLAVADRLELGTSAVALQFLRDGDARFQADDANGAIREYRRAIAADSALGLAYFRLSMARTWGPVWDYAGALEAVEAGLRHEERMPSWSARLLRAQRAFVLRDVAGAVEGFQELTALHPERADAWFGLGEAYLHLGGFAGRPPIEALQPFERAIAIDSTFAPVDHHLIEISLATGDPARARRHLARYPADASLHPAYEAAVRLRFGDGPTRAATLRELRGADRLLLSHLVSLFAHQRLDLPLADTLAGFLVSPDRPLADRTRGAQYQMVLRAPQGRWREGLASWRRVAGSADFDPWLVHADLAGLPTDGLAGPMYARADSLLRSGTPPALDSRTGDQENAFFALVHRAALRGDSAQVNRLLGALDELGAPEEPADPLPGALRASLHARLRLLAGDTVGAIGGLEEASARPLHHYWYLPMLSMAPERALLARLYRARGATREAEEIARSFGLTWYLGDLLFLASRAAMAAP